MSDVHVAERPSPAQTQAGVAGHPLIQVVDLVDERVREGLRHIHRSLAPQLDSGRLLPVTRESLDDLLLPDLHRSLIALLGRPVVLALQVAKLEGTLTGATSAERFAGFVQRLAAAPESAALLTEYPELDRRISVCIDHWVAASAELLARLCDDWLLLRATFGVSGEPVVSRLDIGAGDKHRQGRSVVIITLDTGVRLVYKPRSLGVDQHFQELLVWLNDRGVDPPFRPLLVLDRRDYGWCEFVEPRDCTSNEEVRRFYRRQGGYLALLYALCATDFHHENVVASGEHPLLVDLEALFHPSLVESRLDAALASSVTGVGLLPWRFLPEGADEGIDLSGLGAVAGALSPLEVPQWDRAGTDAMRLGQARTVQVGTDTHAPRLAGAPVEVADHADAVIDGFRSTYELLVTHREDLLATGGPLARFAGDEVRVILRPTQAYAVLLHAALHPDNLRSAIAADRLLDRLWSAAEGLPGGRRVVLAEQRDLTDGDIPLFTARADSRRIRGSHRQEFEALEATGLDLAAQRIKELGPADLTRQAWLVASSLASRTGAAPTSTGGTSRARVPRQHGAPLTTDRLLSGAQRVGQQLADLAFRGDGECTWVGLTLTREQRWVPAPLGAALYDGLPGVALFLAHLGVAVDDAEFTTLAHESLAALRRRAPLDESTLPGLGAFDGRAGAVYALTHLGVLWDEPELLVEAAARAELLGPDIERDDTLDLIGGVAGCVPVLLALHACHPSDRLLQLAVGCGRRLLTTATPTGPGLAWPAPRTGQVPLSGLAHGVAGIAMALHELWEVTGDEAFRDAAQQGLTYERTLYRAEAGNWLDLRDLAPQPGTAPREFRVALCHGAPGIGLARMSLLPHDDGTARSEIEVALATTIRHGWTGSPVLCHGSVGNLELLLEASLRLDEDRWSEELERAASVVLDEVEHTVSRPPATDVRSPDLMTGLAGTGYQLLRLADPVSVPSVPVLAPPAGVRVTPASQLPLS